MESGLRSAAELLAVFGQKYNGQWWPQEVLESDIEGPKFCSHVRMWWGIDADDAKILAALKHAIEHQAY